MGLPISPILATSYSVVYYECLSWMIIMDVYHIFVYSAKSDRSLRLSFSSFILHFLSAPVVSFLHIVLVNLVVHIILKAYLSLPPSLSISIYLSLSFSLSLSLSLSLYLSLSLSLSHSLSLA